VCASAASIQLVPDVSAAAAPTVSPYEFPYGYPFPEYPLAGASHPSQSTDYMRRAPGSQGELKRVGQYTLRLIQTGREKEAVAYAEAFMKKAPGLMDQELLFMKSLAQTRLGDIDGAARTMKRAINQAELPPQRFIAGPRRLFAPLYAHKAFAALREKHKNELVHGPMLGRMTDRGVSVWVRTVDETPVRVAVSRSPQMTEPKIFGPARSSAADDYTAEIDIAGLEPDTAYYYSVLLGDSKAEVRAEHQRFRTFPPAGKHARFRVVFGGCAGYDGLDRERSWGTADQTDPLAVLLLGDNVYIDDPESPDQQRYCYYQRYSVPEYRRLVGSRPMFAIWDDHDFAMDDSWGGLEIDTPYWKPMVWEIFKQNWVNPAYGGGSTQPGVWFDFRIADVHFIMLDGRYYRTDPGRFGGDGVSHPTMLGPHQLAWLKQTLAASDATFKVLVSPVSWNLGAKAGQAGLDGWRGFSEEREEIFGFIEQHKISGVTLLSGDRHRSDAWQILRDNGYDLYEFGSCHFTNIHTHPLIDDALFGYNEKNSFGLLTFDTQADDPSVKYQIINVDGQVKGELKLNLSQLKR
jgi:alkaline phosphatase D